MSDEEDLDAAAVSLVRAWAALGHPCAVIRHDTQENFRLICLETLDVAPLLKHAAQELETREQRHRC